MSQYKGKKKDNNSDVPKSTKSLDFKLRYVNQRKWMKGTSIPHLAKSTGGKDSLLSKPTVTIDQKQASAERAGQHQQAAVNAREGGVITGTQRPLLS